MISKVTEDTITSLLKEELEKLGVHVQIIPSIETPVGLRKPDLLCSNGGFYPVEAKFTERDKYEGIVGVACGQEVRLGGEGLKQMGQAGQAVPLIKNGCANMSFSLQSLEKML